MTKIIFLLCLLVSFAIYATDAPAPITTPSLNQTMTQIGLVMIDVFPLIVAKRAFTNDEKNRLGKALSQLVELFAKAGVHIEKKSDAYQISYEFVAQHLTITKQAYDSGDLDQARGRLYALGAICASCHTQDSEPRTLFSGAKRQRFDDDISYAEFNFITRNYPEAIKYYDKFLMSKEAKTEYEIIQPLQQLVTIYAQILSEPGEGAKKLARYSNLNDHSDATKNQLAGWIDGLRALETQGLSGKPTPDFNTVKKYVVRYLGKLDTLPAQDFSSSPQEEISRVWLRGLLYRYLNDHPKSDEIPQILYWLAICDRSIDYVFYFSLADLYLKDCILNHADHPYAKRCYEEYNAFIVTTYSGPAGTFIPTEVQEDLDSLKKAMQK